MSLTQHPSNRLTGFYNSNTSIPELGDNNGTIVGSVFTTTNGSLIAFNVIFGAGISPISWVGECLSCAGEEKLYTTWVWVLYEQVPHDRYLTIRVNEDTFRRLTTQTASQDIDDKPEEDTSLIKCSDFKLPWTSKSGDSIKATYVYEDGNVWSGTRSTSDGKNHIYGQIKGNETFSAVGIVETQSTKARGLAGHIYHPSDKKKVLEFAWLEHSLSGDCSKPRKLVKYGKDRYTSECPT